jgi:hypothetical protein
MAQMEVEVTPPVPRWCGHPPGIRNKKTLAAITAAAATTSSPTATTTAGMIVHALMVAPPAYTPVEGFRCFIIPVLAGATRLLCLPSKFSEIIGDFNISQAVIWEGCGWQLPYEVEIFKDGEGQNFLRSGWPQFCTDYGV